MRGKATGVLLGIQVILIILFGVFVDYDDIAVEVAENSTVAFGLQLNQLYPMYLDVHVMMLIGFGFLMTFLQRHGFGSIAFNFLLTCYVIEWSCLVNGWFGLIESDHSKIKLNIESLLQADFAVASVLISFGAILGVASPVQLIIMATIEIVLYNVNIYIGVNIFKATDIGGSIFVHSFGAYFGLAVGRVLYKPAQTKSEKEGSVYHSDLFAMIGSLFLWVYWPSFNGALAVGDFRLRAIVNTVLGLSACTVVTFAISSVVNPKGKLNMVHVQNATLAGGVAMGASADLVIYPFGALLIGASAAIVSVLGYEYIQPALQNYFNLHDTCGVHNLHGMPGVLGAIASAIAIGAATQEVYQTSYEELFDERTISAQAGYQMAAIGVTIAICVVGGALTGLVLKIPFLDNLEDNELYEDDVFWICEEDEGDTTTKKTSHQLETVQ